MPTTSIGKQLLTTLAGHSTDGKAIAAEAVFSAHEREDVIRNSGVSVGGGVLGTGLAEGSSAAHGGAMTLVHKLRSFLEGLEGGRVNDVLLQTVLVAVGTREQMLDFHLPGFVDRECHGGSGQGEEGEELHFPRKLRAIE